MATPKRSPMELADLVEVTASPHPGAPRLESDEEAARDERDAKIEIIMRERQVPRAIAIIMVDKGYSRGTAFRIWNDEQKRLTAAREAAHAAEMAKRAKAKPKEAAA